MKLIVRRTSQFKRDVKRIVRSGKDIDRLFDVIEKLIEKRELSFEYHDHPLSGNYKNKRDCHIESDWILIYAIENDELILYRTGNHSQLFS